MYHGINFFHKEILFAARDPSTLSLRIKEITETRVRYGSPRVYVMLPRRILRDVPG
jgi:hypothetical protein